MKKTKDISPKLSSVKSAEEELYLPVLDTPIGQQVGGLSTFSNSFKRGSGNKVFGSDDNGIWLGAADYPDAPFKVDYDGHVIATSADFSGAGYSKLTIFKQDNIPTSVSIGDLWFDTNDGNKLYRAGAVGATTIATGQWELVASTTISIFAQDSIPTSLAIGDLWYDTNDNNKVYRAASIGADAVTTGEWVAVDDLRAADALLKSESGQNLSGTIEVGAENIKIDGANKRIVINDGTRDIILIGYQAGGF